MTLVRAFVMASKLTCNAALSSFAVWTMVSYPTVIRLAWWSLFRKWKLSCFIVLARLFYQSVVILVRLQKLKFIYELRHDKTNKVSVRPAKTQISLGIRSVWSESSLSAWRNIWSLATHWAHSEDSDQTGRMSRLIWVFAGRTLILLVL